MWFISTRRPNSGRRSQAIRRVRPMVEGFESRLLMTGATGATAVISGVVSRDITGNGASSDDVVAHGGVTVQLFNSSGSTPIASTVSDSNGNFSFKGLALGTYSVQEVTPTGWTQTEAVNGYSVTLTKNGQTVAHEDFDNFDSPLYSTSAVSDIRYTVTSINGATTHPTSLSGQIQPGDTVTAHFLLSKPEMVEFVTYVAPNSTFDTSNLQKQVIFGKQESSTTVNGYQTATVTVPDGYFQIDLVAGPTINHLAANANTTYHAEDRFIDGATGGTQTNGPSTVSGSVALAPAKGQKVGTGIAGVTVVLTGYDYTGKSVSLKAVTDANGNFTFSNLIASDSSGYRISQVVPTNYVQSQSTAGTTGNLWGPSGKFITTFLNTNTSSTGNKFVDSPSTT